MEKTEIIGCSGVGHLLTEAMQKKTISKEMNAKTINEIIEEERGIKITICRPPQDPALLNRTAFPAPRSKYHK